MVESARQIVCSLTYISGGREYPAHFISCCRIEPTHFISLFAIAVGLLRSFARIRPRQRNRDYIARWPVRFPRIVSQVFPNDVDDLDRGHPARHAGHPVLSRDTEQLLMHQEAIGKALHPAQTCRVILDVSRVSASFTVYACADFQEVAARSTDVRLLRCALLASAGRRANEENPKQCSNKNVAHISLQSVARFYVCFTTLSAEAPL